jgi:TonB-dependent starch-binding outer membrane protein SusC
MKHHCRFRILPALIGVLMWTASASAQDAPGAITGRVVDASSQRPIAGVTITIQGIQRGFVTRADGMFLLTAVPVGTHQVRTSMLGYGGAVREVTVVAGGTATVQFELQPVAIQLDELVATGYGTQRRRDLTGAVATVSGEAMQTPAAPVVAINNALVGRAPGVQVITNSGIPGAGASIRVRGTNSIAANSEPLYVIDGMPVGQGTTSSNPTQNPLATINPNDIESIEILKDASATAIYGARASNGVLLITTRRGQRGLDQISLSSSYGVQDISKRIDVLNARQYRELRNEARTNVGLTPHYSANELNVPTYDYIGAMLRTAPQTDHALALSGGDDRTRFLVSGNYMRQEGIILNTDFERYSGRFNLTRDVSDRFQLQTNLSLAKVNHNLADAETGGMGNEARGLLGAMVYDPATPMRNEDGTWVRGTTLGEFLINPVATVSDLISRRNESRLIGQLQGAYRVTDELRLQSSIGANISNIRNPWFVPSTIQQGYNTQGAIGIWTGQGNDFQIRNQAQFTRAGVGPGNLDLLAAFDVETNDFEWSQSNATHCPIEAMRWDNLGACGTAANPAEAYSGASESALISYVGRANYNIADRYLFTVTGRRDGSSRFGVENKWAFFPSAAFAWRLSEEAFMANQNLFDDLKLRLSYGVTGNQPAESYQSLARMGISRGGDGGVVYVPSRRAPNPHLRWETTRQFNGGLDLSFLSHRVNVVVDAYTSTTDDLLSVVEVAHTSGYADQMRNIGSLQNRGVELGLNTVNVDNGRFSWRSAFNVAANRNKVLALPEGIERMLFEARGAWAMGGHTHIVEVGKPLGNFYGYNVLGIFQQGMACHLTAPRTLDQLDCVPGEMIIEDVNGDGAITDQDRTVVGNADPKFFGGLNNSFSFGRFSLDAFMSFSYGNEVLNASNTYQMLGVGALNERAEMLNRWTPTNTNTDIPRANANRKSLLYSTLVEDASFLRLQSVTLGYEVPTRFVPGASGARLYFTGQNLLTLTGYSGFDPEVNSMGGSPVMRGIDIGGYPRSRILNFGVNVTF